MASLVPAKSQSLHNFPLPHLKCKKNRSRLADSSPHQSMSLDGPRFQSSKHDVPARRSPMHNSASRRSPIHSPSSMLGVDRRESPTRDPGDRINSGRDSVKNVYTAPPSGLVTEKPDKKLKISEGKEAGSKIYIRLNKNTAGEIQDEDKNEEIKTCVVEGEGQESMAKTWNFRPRKPLFKPNHSNGGGAPRLVGSSTDIKAQLPLAAEVAADGREKEKKMKFSINLSKDEIEEDVFAMTGAKATRRPKKRPRTVRKILDNLFPGLWLASITPDSYKVSENPAKG